MHRPRIPLQAMKIIEAHASCNRYDLGVFLNEAPPPDDPRFGFDKLRHDRWKCWVALRAARGERSRRSLYPATHIAAWFHVSYGTVLEGTNKAFRERQRKNARRRMAISTIRHLAFTYHPPRGPALVLPRCLVTPYVGYSDPPRAPWPCSAKPWEVECMTCLRFAGLLRCEEAA